MLSLWRGWSSKPETDRSRGNVENRDVVRANAEQKSQVTYASRSKGVEFVCHLPKDSKYASQAQKLSLEIYTDRRAAPKGIEDRKNARLMLREGGEESYEEVATDRRYTETLEEVRRRALPATEVVDRTARNRRHHSANISNDNKALAQVDSGSENHRARDSFKHTSDTHESYVLRQPGREMFVSAPIGSREAELHDQVAMKAATPKVSPTLKYELHRADEI
ncbi:hypothetical protein H2198_001349 [Neophaeococcomyces mojaviensis]|uniref:Uncharacterized protein n=1 Tax=Neophaeococcomyces mojaviensis TaxID=3383035 RepID=A0ACC3AH92_9EURO|nr:hypothetical protein H2198_001349 [Knufia sp. JES_112]